MTEWRKVKLGDICSIKSGKRLPKGADFSSCPTENKYIRARDIKNGVINGEDLAFISNEVKERISKYIVNTNDVIVTIAGTIGEVAFVTSQYDGVNLTENAIRLTDFDHEVNSKYVFYTLRSNDYYEYMQKIAGGAAQPKMGIYKVEAISIALPSIDTQERIVDILSRYDALIENYQRQIKLLEEAAQRLYKEWFVDLRFPGHQSTPIINNLPQSWQKKKLGEIAEFKRGKTITKKDIIEGVVPVVAGGLEPAYYCNKSNTDKRVVTVSGSGANAGFTRMYFEKVWASDCSFVDCSSTRYLHFVYCFLIANKSSLDVMQKGSAQPHVYAKDINAMDILVPPFNVLDSFEREASKLFDVIASRNNQIRNLSEARDRLLPKLMSAEIVV